MDDLHASIGERRAAAAASEKDNDGSHHRYRDFPTQSLTSSQQDDLDLQKLGYKSVLARGWGGFDNFACSFSALYVIGGIRVLFSIALNNGGPAAMVSTISYTDSSLITGKSLLWHVPNVAVIDKS